MPQPYSADLHIHSCLSPCGGDDMVPTRVVEAVKEKGIQIFSITDHNAIGNLQSLIFGGGRWSI